MVILLKNNHISNERTIIDKSLYRRKYLGKSTDFRAKTAVRACLTPDRSNSAALGNPGNSSAGMRPETPVKLNRVLVSSHEGVMCRNILQVR